MSHSTPPSPKVVGPLTLTDFVRYQGASGDMNPSHHDHEFAQRNGSPGAFAPGLLSAAIMADWATEWLGPKNIRSFSVRFVSPVYVGDTLTVSGEYDADAEISPTRIALKISCKKQDGTLVTTATALFVSA